ncbi:MAG: hypothetical protein CVU78_06915 [Elusimicrobia bacterium HGW-Elusimicrobia-2]|nr:MAG: hypothetical protein CVU78_06915 [Elusimicrobia bacterium HGW-Elusimicrobia-2]
MRKKSRKNKAPGRDEHRAGPARVWPAPVSRNIDSNSATRFSRPLASYAAAGGVILIFLALFSAKLSIFDKGCNIDAGEFGLFRVEEATRYRYAKLVSEGQKIPGIDHRIQYPEGLNVKKYFTTLSQRVLGGTYRFFHFKTPFHKFVIYFMFLYSSLSIIALYKSARLLGGSRMMSLAACAFYAGSFASSSRTIAGGLVEEDFALPLMFFALLFVLKALKSRKRAYPIAAGALLAGAVSAWHVSQFFYLILTAILCFIYICRNEERDNIFNLLAPVIAILTAAGIVVPVLRGGYFLLSFSQLLGYAFILLHLIGSKFRFLVKNIITTSTVFLILTGIIFVASRPILKEHAKNYGHVYTLMFNKIRYFGNKPTFEAEVKKLPFDTKVLWQSSFVSPGMQFTKEIFLIAFIFALPGLFAGALKIIKEKDSGVFISMAALAGFFILFLLVKRLYVFVIYFLCILMPLATAFLQKRKYYFAACAIFFAGSAMQWDTAYPKLKNVPRRINTYKQDLIKRMNEKLPPGSVLLCNIGIAPEIVQNSSFSTVLHNHYEEKNIRDKTEEFYKRMYGSEKDLYGFAKQYGAEYLIYHWEFLFDKSVNSMRYQVDAMNLFKTCAAYRLHFDEKNLEYFTLIYQNDYYRLFKIHSATAPDGQEGTGRDFHRKAAPAELEYVPFFNSLVFEPQDKILYMEDMREKGPLFDDEYARGKMDAVWSLPQLKNRSDAAIASGNFEEAEKIYLKMLETDPYYSRTRIIISDFYMRSGQYSKALPHTLWLVQNYPSAQSYYYLTESLRASGYEKEARDAAEEARKLFPKDLRSKQ